MSDFALSTPPGKAAAANQLRQLAAVAFQVALLSLVFAGWLGGWVIRSRVSPR